MRRRRALGLLPPSYGRGSILTAGFASPRFVSHVCSGCSPDQPLGRACAMRLHPMWGLILFFLDALATTSLAYGGDGTPAGYERREIEGFTVYVNKTVL